MTRAAGAAAGAGSAAGSYDYVGLVRGINVGANNRITMADFRALFEGLGYTDVATLLQSGNVVFTSTRPLAAPDVAAIESAFAAAAGFRASFVVLSAAQFEAAVAANPLLPPAAPLSGAAAAEPRDPSRLVITFLPQPFPPTSVLPASASRGPATGADAIVLPDADSIRPETVVLGDHAVYSWHPDGISKSRIPPTFWKQLGPTYTARNVATAAKLVALLHARSG